MNVPLSRLERGQGFQIGRAAEITRDEVKFSKFIHRMRLRFSHLFDDLLKKQLVSKNIITLDEWPSIKEVLKYDFASDNHYAELKDAEVLKNRLEVLRDIDSYTGTYFSKEWVKRNVLLQTGDERRRIALEIEDEKNTQDESVPDNTDLDFN